MKRKRVIVLFMVLILIVSFVIPLSGCSKEDDKVLIVSMDQLKESKIGVETGSIFDSEIKKICPNCTVEYFSSTYDMFAAVSSGKIDAVVCDEAFAKRYTSENNNYTILEKISNNPTGFIYQKDTEKSLKLVQEMNEFLAEAEKDGTLDEINDIWINNDKERMNIDLSGLTGENGSLLFGIASSGAEPFIYYKDGQVVGYEMDLLVRFCKKYGYKLEVKDFDFVGLISAVSAGKVDIGGSCVTITDERKEQLLYSDPIYSAGGVVVVEKLTPMYSTVEELSGKRAAVVVGSIFDKVAEKYVKDVTVEYMNSTADLSVALNSDKADFFITDLPVAKYVLAQNPNQSIMGILEDDHYGIIFQKNNEKSANLCKQINEYLAKTKADGRHEKLIDSWLGADADNLIIDYENLPAENGTLTFAFSTNIGAPYAYIKDGRYAGYEIAIAVNFCKEYGYGIKLFDTDFSGVLTAVSMGKADFGSSGISITEERKESMLFSDSTYDGGIAVVVKNNYSGAANESFIDNIVESFNKTFIRENRWKMFLSGIGITMLVTVLSAILGSALGFLFFLIYRKKQKIIVSVFDFISNLLEKLPIVVILMILYYVIFGKSDIDGVIIAIIGFTILFTFNVLGLIKTGVDTIDIGQMEAALALGYTDNSAFLRVIFPQAFKHIMPGYKGALVSLIKDTAIVGYIAVQDLTKVSDIVRSRTYEAFFPLIATALIYFGLALLLIMIVQGVEIKVDPRNRKKEQILKGVETK